MTFPRHCASLPRAAVSAFSSAARPSLHLGLHCCHLNRLSSCPRFPAAFAASGPSVFPASYFPASFRSACRIGLPFVYLVSFVPFGLRASACRPVAFDRLACLPFPAACPVYSRAEEASFVRASASRRLAYSPAYPCREAEASPLPTRQAFDPNRPSVAFRRMAAASWSPLRRFAGASCLPTRQASAFPKRLPSEAEASSQHPVRTPRSRRQPRRRC